MVRDAGYNAGLQASAVGVTTAAVLWTGATKLMEGLQQAREDRAQACVDRAQAIYDAWLDDRLRTAALDARRCDELEAEVDMLKGKVMSAWGEVVRLRKQLAAAGVRA